MGNGDHAVHINQLSAGEVGNIRGHFALFQSLDHIVRIGQVATGKVHHAHRIFHFGNAFGTNQLLGVRGQRHMHGDIVCQGEHLIQIIVDGYARLEYRGVL